MINKKPLSQSKWLKKNRLIKPLYQDYSFGNIPSTVIYLLTKEKIGNLLPEDCFLTNHYPRPKKVILLLVFNLIKVPFFPLPLLKFEKPPL